MAAPTPIVKGITTIVWGTGNMLSNIAGAIVDSIQITPKNGGPLFEIENNDGATVSAGLLVDGFDAKVSVVYDSAKAWPVEGANSTLTMPVATGNANAAATAYKCLVVSQAPAPARKKEMMLEINLMYRPGMDV
jgi:hypothetical protein